ncbi:hypothetical protein QVH35_03390 [Candidatus Nitrosotenuis chungbukensis]|uniref:hypothetical protein n=1 Tax=Candidatus Nitrosotenuis chungbukensis TaxID=1353246 RepID=UPI002673D250|nr:hypothetical protein [Candidatus Nitrosotenuis chungbukensis]WKT58460.1 hypothetical protein QVH35_03390 [Candidatus Nitrosotenuis chungbukensis]
MRKSVLLFTLLSILTLTSGAQLAAAQASDNKEKMNIIQNCEKIYPELQKLGNIKFRERYQYFDSFRDCIVLYNDSRWDSTDSDRIDRLVLLLEKPIQTKIIRDRFNDTPSIPPWIKDDAKRWEEGDEKDNVFSYGIRYMMNSKIIKSANALDYKNCSSGSICLSQNDFVKYSIKNSGNNDTIILTHTFGDEFNNIIPVISEESSKNSKSVTNFQINKTTGLVKHDKKCCIQYPFVHQIPMALGTKLNQEHSSEVVSEVIFSFKDYKRPSFVAKEKTGKYLEIVDKETGIVFFSKYQDKTKPLQTVQLVDTNILKKDTTIRYNDMKIPFWFKNTVKWWTEGKISDSEYVSGISYLLKNDILRI